MADLEGLRPIETSPLTPLRERPRRKNDHDFDLQRELAGERREDEDEPASDGASAEVRDAPVAPRAEDEAGGRIDLTA
ncbi:MAG TPA: hypothetical protein VMT18_09635 [Planctomycetota bacterium]|nr:hypothetical protein [Planctomycetota bacterium]